MGEKSEIPRRDRPILTLAERELALIRKKASRKKYARRKKWDTLTIRDRAEFKIQASVSIPETKLVETLGSDNVSAVFKTKRCSLGYEIIRFYDENARKFLRKNGFDIWFGDAKPIIVYYNHDTKSFEITQAE